jgi:hypothetical protein
MRSVNGEIIGAVIYCIVAALLWATDTDGFILITLIIK